MHELPRIVADEPIGKEVPVLVLRKGKEQTMTVKLGRLDEADKTEGGQRRARQGSPPPKVITGPLGLTLSDLSPSIRSQFGIKDSVTGVVVTEVADGSAAAEKRLQPGDVIVEISQEAGGERRRRQQAHRQPEEGRPQVGAPPPRQQGRRSSLRGGEDRD